MWTVVIYILLALTVGWFGTNRKFGFWGYFFASVFLTPLMGALLVVASDPRRREPEPRYVECQCREEMR